MKSLTDKEIAALDKKIELLTPKVHKAKETYVDVVNKMVWRK